MIPSKDDMRWKDLITGKIEHNFSSVSAGMNLSRNKRKYTRSPNETTLLECVDDVYKFFQKFESVLADDMKVIFQ